MGLPLIACTCGRRFTKGDYELIYAAQRGEITYEEVYKLVGGLGCCKIRMFTAPLGDDPLDRRHNARTAAVNQRDITALYYTSGAWSRERWRERIAYRKALDSSAAASASSEKRDNDDDDDDEEEEELLIQPSIRQPGAPKTLAKCTGPSRLPVRVSARPNTDWFRYNSSQTTCYMDRLPDEHDTIPDLHTLVGPCTSWNSGVHLNISPNPEPDVGMSYERMIQFIHQWSTLSQQRSVWSSWMNETLTPLQTWLLLWAHKRYTAPDYKHIKLTLQTMGVEEDDRLMEHLLATGVSARVTDDLWNVLSRTSERVTQTIHMSDLVDRWGVVAVFGS